jgi:hypothetical protein
MGNKGRNQFFKDSKKKHCLLYIRCWRWRLQLKGMVFFSFNKPVKTGNPALKWITRESFQDEPNSSKIRIFNSWGVVVISCPQFDGGDLEDIVDKTD